MPRVVASSVVDTAGLDSVMRPRTDLLSEQAGEDGIFTAASGPVTSYERRVVVEPMDDGRFKVTQDVDFRLAVPYFNWLFVGPFKRAIVRPAGRRPPWWAPPQALDAQAATVLGTLCVLAVVSGYLNTLFTQTVAFAGEEFGTGNQAQGVAGSVVRLGGLAALVVLSAADRQGRRRVILAAAAAGCILAVSGAAAPSLPWLVGSQTTARAFATALLLLLGILAAEEVPAGSRAYAVSLLAMAAGLGAGMAILALNLADIGEGGWRLLYVLPLLGVPLVVSARRRLPESRRFAAPHPEVRMAGHGRRLWLLAGSGMLANLFIAPQSQFNNQFLRTERGFSGGRISLLTLLAGAPGAVGIVAGGRLADVRGRRKVAAVALVFGTVCTVMYFYSRGWSLWIWPMVGNMISAASIPALGVYGPELFPTSLRGRANGLVAVCSLGGSAIGLILAGTLADHFGRIGPAMACLAAGPVIVAMLVLAFYPETARRELEELNPEDRAAAP